MKSSSSVRPLSVVFAHDWRDGLLVAVTLAELASKWALCLFWSSLSFPLIGLSMAGLVVLNGMNYICAAHDFLHLPFFTRKWANRVWGVFASLALTMPVSLYRVYHLNHHRFGMDHRDSATGNTKDWSSIYRHGPAPDRPEPLWRYALTRPLRLSLWALIVEARRHGDGLQLAAEFAALIIAATILGVLNWKGFLFIYLPIYYLGQVLAMAEAYSEHVGATPGDRQKDSASCYNRLYNFLCFNNGYHQEHHFRPGVHWTQTPKLKDQLPPATERRVVPGSHLVNVLLRRDV